MSLWGNHEWGTTRWGADGATESWEATNEPDSKPYTLFLGKSPTGLGSELGTDLGQDGDDADGNASGYCYFTAGNGDHFCRSSPRSIIAVLDALDNTDTGFIFQYDGAAPTAASAFALEIYDNGGTKTLAAYIDGTRDSGSLLAVPGLSATASQVVVVWASRDNPGTTGAGDAVEHEIRAYNVSTGAYDQIRWTSAAQTTTTGKTVTWMAQTTAGAGAFSSAIALALRFDKHYCTAVEMREDWILKSDPLTTGTTLERPPIPATKASGVGDAGEFFGLAPAFAAVAQRSLYRRTSWPLVNRRYRSPRTYTSSSTGATIRLAPGSAAYLMPRELLHGPVPVHPGCDYAWVRVHAKLYVTSGASVPIGIRVYSFNKRPGDLGKLTLGEPKESFASSYTEMITDRDDTGGVGSYIAFTNLLKIRRASGGIRKGKTYIAVAFLVDPNAASGNDANARIEINALHVIPVKTADSQNGLGGDFGIKNP